MNIKYIDYSLGYFLHDQFKFYRELTAIINKM